MRKPAVRKSSPPTGPSSWGNRVYVMLGAVALVALVTLGIFLLSPAPAPVRTTAAPVAPTAAPSRPTATLVDESACQGCHAAQAKDWQGSHHQMAMLAAAPETVAGDFDQAVFKGERETTRFFRQGDEFWVNTPGADGQRADFKVAYTFGVAPLQQYLLQVPGGRLQALGVAWDTQQHRWFHLYPGQGVNFKDPLHWSQPGQNANFMCVECHTTGYKREFDAANNQFNSHWNSLGVGCQACHGPASNHLAWAAKSDASVLDKGLVVNLASANASSEIDTCARCHARRAPLGDGYANDHAFMDDYLPSALTRELYALDGKIKDEVFEHGAFQQSKMFDKGVRCSNCHDPHSEQLKVSGNGVCLQCHNTAGVAAYPTVDGRGLQAKDYTAVEHTHHQPGQPGSQCVDCHMPGKFYMVNDYRHDHGFTLPNPPRAQRLGTPDACLSCHAASDAAKVSEQFRLWYGPDKPQPPRYDEGLYLIRNGRPGAAEALITLLQQNNLPAIRRATLLAEVPAYPGANTLRLVARDLHSAAPQVRESAVHALAALMPPAQRAEYLVPLLDDPVRAVRIAAARELLGAGPGLGTGQAAWQRRIDEYESVQKNLLERAEANFNLATLYQASGRASEVEPALRAALLRDPGFLPAVVSLSQWLEQHGRADDARSLLADQVNRHPASGLLRQTQALALIRAGRTAEAMVALREAVRLEPDNAHYGFVLAVALHDTGHPDQAITQLQRSLVQQPGNREVRLTLAQYYQEQGQAGQAAHLLAELTGINPDDPAIQAAAAP